MQSGFKVELSEKAENDLSKIIDYLLVNWNQMTVRNFLKKFYNQIDLISSFPDLYPKTIIKKNIHRAVLTKHITIYYEINSELINILRLYDTRQNPNKLKIK